MSGHKRGTVVLVDDPFCRASGRRPYVIISDESYPFYPDGYLGLPLTSKDKTNTYEITEYDIEKKWEDFITSPNYVNPYSPFQLNDVGRPICVLDESFLDLLVDKVAKSFGIVQKA